MTSSEPPYQSVMGFRNQTTSRIMTNRFVDIEFRTSRRSNAIKGFEEYPVVSLYQSLEQVIASSTVPGLLNSIREARVKCRRDDQYGLTIDESAAIYLYTMPTGFYVELNRLLRIGNKDRNSLRKWFFYLKLFTSALQKLPSVKDRVWRGVRCNHVNLEESVIIWPSFSSCSRRLDVVQVFLDDEGCDQDRRFLYAIECLNGKDLSVFSAVPDEKEILLMPETLLRFKSNPLHLMRNNLRIFDLEEIDIVQRTSDEDIFYLDLETPLLQSTGAQSPPPRRDEGWQYFSPSNIYERNLARFDAVKQFICKKWDEH